MKFRLRQFVLQTATVLAATCLSAAFAGAQPAPTTTPAQPTQRNSENGNGSGNSNGSTSFRQGYRRNRDQNNNRDGNNRETNRTGNGVSGGAGETYADKYTILADQNIFLRDRTRPNRGGPTTQSAPASPEQLLTLTGVVFEDGQYRAYVEDLRSGRVQRLSEGDSVARGRISQIDIDAIEYDTGSPQKTWVSVGSDMTGKTANPALVGGAGGDADTGPKLDPNDPTLTPEQRLRARRQQLLGK